MIDNTKLNVLWPTHAYVPGQNERHLEDAFDSVTVGVSTALSVQELTECSAFQHGLVYLEAGYYWEAHEVFEPVWMSLPDQSRERQFVQALIQVANAHLKHRMQRPKAASRLCDISKKLLGGNSDTEIMGVSSATISDMITRLEARI